MSWSFRFAMPCCDITCADGGNLTYNLSAMMIEANIHPSDVLKNKTGKELAILLREAWAEMIKNPNKFKKHNPPNKWGSFDGLVGWIEETVHTAENYPKSIFKVDE